MIYFFTVTMPFSFMIILFGVLSKLLNKEKSSKRLILVYTVLLTSVLLLLITEILSLLNQVNFIGLSITWITLNLIGLITYLRLPSSEDFFSIRSIFSKLSFFGIGSLLILFFSFVFLFFISVIFPPNNWDSMTYHLSRVEHWISNENINYYPTHIPWQLFYPNLSEIFILHLKILSNSDFFVQSVQLFFCFSTLILITLIVKLFNLGERWQLFTAVFCFTLPIGLYECTSTQNEYVLSFFVSSSFFFLFKFLKHATRTNALFLVISIGLAVATKSLAYLFCLPIVIIYTVHFFRNISWQSIKFNFLLITVFLFINLGTYLRNVLLFKDPIGITYVENENSKQPNSGFNTEMSFKPIISNGTKHIAYNLSEPFYSGWNNNIEIILSGIHRIFGMELISLKYSTERYKMSSQFGLKYSENAAANPIHLLFILVSLLLFIFYPQKNNWKLWLYFILILSGYILFCWYLKWQPYSSRFLLPYLILLSVFPVIQMGKIRNRRISFLLPNSLIILFLLIGSFYVRMGLSKPLVSLKEVMKTNREQGYFIHRKDLYANYFNITEKISKRGIHNVGLEMANSDTWEYPLLVLLKKKKISFKHVNVKNVSSKIIADVKKTQLTLFIDNSKNQIIEKWNQ